MSMKFRTMNYVFVYLDTFLCDSITKDEILNEINFPMNSINVLYTGVRIMWK